MGLHLFAATKGATACDRGEIGGVQLTGCEDRAIEVRWAVSQDEKQLAELWWLMQAFHHRLEPRLYADKGKAACKRSWGEHFRELLDKEDALIVVAVTGESVVGMILGQLRSRPPIYTIPRVMNIDSAAVHPDYRRAGVFRRLLQFLEAAAKARGVDVVQLAVHKDNQATQAYLRTGFQRVTEGMAKWLDWQSR
jgi:ribosomal protein S18 acetylase RimI-like enzyme